MSGESGCFRAFRALPRAVCAGYRRWRGLPGTRPGESGAAGSAGSGAVSGRMAGNHSRQESGGAAVTVRFSVTVRQVLEDGSEAPVEGEVAAALAGPAEQFAGLAAWAADEARFCDHGEREKVIGEEGRELQRRLLQAAFDIDSAREQRAAQVTSAAGIRHGTVEAGHGRGVASVFGPVRVTRMAYRNRREPNLYPADARQVLPDDPYSLGMRALAAFHLAGGGFGQAQEVIEARTGVTVGRAQLTGLAEDLAAWTDDFYAGRSRDAEEEEQPDSDVIMMQGDGKGIAMRPEHRKGAGKADAGHPGIKKMAEIVAVADFTPAVREPEDIAAPPARRRAHPGPKARDKWVSASVTEYIEDMIAAAFDEDDRRDPERARQRVFLVDGNKQQITAIQAQAGERGLKVPVLIDYIHVSGYLDDYMRYYKKRYRNEHHLARYDEDTIDRLNLAA